MPEVGVVFDVEGPLGHAGQNQADDVTRHLQSLGRLTQDEYDGIWKVFDDYDDQEHYRERFRWSERVITDAHGWDSEDPDIYRRRLTSIKAFGKPLAVPRWSTGTSPEVVQCYAAMRGLTDEEQYELSINRLLLVDGVPELLQYLKENDIDIYLMTSAYPAVALTLGKEFGIPSSRIYTMGFRPSPERLKQFDEHPDVMTELKERSLIPRLAPYTKELEEWLPGLIASRKKLQEARRNKADDADELEQRDHIDLFNDMKYYRILDVMRKIFVDKSIVNGSQQKGESTFLIGRNGKRLIGFGDSIVDDTFLLYISSLGGTSFAIDCTNPNALYAASASICTLDRRALIPVISDVVEGRFDPAATAQRIPQEYGTRLFSSYDARRDLKGVISAHNHVKGALRVEYNRVMAEKARVQL